MHPNIDCWKCTWINGICHEQYPTIRPNIWKCMPQVSAWKVFEQQKVLCENHLEKRENGIMEFDQRRMELHIEMQRIHDGQILAAIFLSWLMRTSSWTVIFCRKSLSKNKVAAFLLISKPFRELYSVKQLPCRFLKRRLFLMCFFPMKFAGTSGFMI